MTGRAAQARTNEAKMCERRAGSCVGGEHLALAEVCAGAASARAGPLSCLQALSCGRPRATSRDS